MTKFIVLRAESIRKLQNRQKAIVHESAEDEGAAEHHGEIQSVIDVLVDDKATCEQIREAAYNVGLSSDITLRESRG